MAAGSTGGSRSGAGDPGKGRKPVEGASLSTPLLWGNGDPVYCTTLGGGVEHTQQLSHPKDEKDGEFSHQLPTVISLTPVPRDVNSPALSAS